VAGSYVALKMTKPRLFENLSFQFYIIPLGTPPPPPFRPRTRTTAHAHASSHCLSLASDIEGRSSNFPHFLAKHDGWYGRYVAANSPLFCPPTTPNQCELTDYCAGPTCPGTSCV
jgi:hypothetical protein